MVTLLLTMSRETAPWSWSYFAGLAEAGTEGWEDSRKDGRWGMGAACGCFPSGSISVCTHTPAHTGPAWMLMAFPSRGLTLGLSQLLAEVLSQLSILRSEGWKRAACGEAEQSDSGKMFKMEADFRVRLIHPLTWRMSLAWRPGCHQYGRNDGILKSHLCPLTSLSDY